MNAADREDVLMIVEAALDEYLAEPLVKDILSEIDQSIQDNWHILKLIRERQGKDE